MEDDDVTGQRISEVFVELASTLVDDFDVVDFLHLLTDRCVELLAVSSSGIVLSDESGRLQVVASTSRTTHDLELLELETHEGPCVATFATGDPIVNLDMATAAVRWPTFAAAAAETGVVRATSLPLRLRGRVIGALNLFSDAGEPLADTAVALGQALADVATIGLINERRCASGRCCRNSCRTRCRAGSSSSRPRASSPRGRGSASRTPSSGCVTGPAAPGYR